MKELVCVAPDGSLEVWRRGYLKSLEQKADYRWDIERKKGHENNYHYIVDYTVERIQSPEFWGREVLGEL